MSKKNPFIGREQKLTRLRDLYSKKSKSLVVIKGRRRIGKSRLIQEFAKKCSKSQWWDFSGLAPSEGMDAQTQRDHFGRRLSAMLKVPPISFSDWSDALDYLSVHVRAGDIVSFDEISWMGEQDPAFTSKLKDWWDRQEVPFMLFLCGSVSTWIEDNLINSTAFLGRINLTIGLEPLTIPQSYKLLKSLGFKGSSFDAFKLLSVFGGVPWYIEQFQPGIDVDTLIRRMCFEEGGVLVHEFDRIFHDLFGSKGTHYRRILDALKNGHRTLVQIRKEIAFARSGILSQLMEHLIAAGFVERQNLWSFKTMKPLKQSLYRIADPYLRFYLKMIEPNRGQIQLGAFSNKRIEALPGFESQFGLQLEYLLLQNRPLLLKSIEINPSTVVCDGPYRQSSTASRDGCQIDYLVQTQTMNLFICEFKFKRRELGVEVIEQVKGAEKSLVSPKGFAAIPVLFHLAGVSTSVESQNYFYRIVPIDSFLEDFEI